MPRRCRNDEMICFANTRARFAGETRCQIFSLRAGPALVASLTLSRYAGLAKRDRIEMGAIMRLCGRLVEVDHLSAQDRRRMLELMNQYYTNVAPATFGADLAEKRWVIQIVHPSTHELCGFSTQMVLDAIVQDRPIKALFSGDTIIGGLGLAAWLRRRPCRWRAR